MAEPRMHADEVATNAALVRRLLAAQFPQWAELPIERVASAGTDNALYRLGAELVVRLPRIHWAAGGVAKDARWLPELAPLLPVAVSAPVAVGSPGDGYPWQWGVYPWLAGETAAEGAATVSLAHALARFVRALRSSGLGAGPPAAGRGVPLAERDEATRAAIAALAGVVDFGAVTAAWDAALGVPPWAHAPVWVHGDLAPGNLLLRGGRLAAVIDWGSLGVGDPAADLIVGWNFLPPGPRRVFREEVAVDDATWARGRGLALSVALIQLPYYAETNPPLAANARYALAQVLADAER